MSVNADHIHPFRFRRTRPFARIMGKLAQENPSGFISENELNRIADVVIPQYNDHIAKVPVDDRPGGTTVVMEELSLATHFLMWVRNGRNTFLLTPALVEMLQRTDMEGVRLEDITLPFKCLYLSFGDAFGGRLPGDESRIDGAYIEDYGDAITVTVTSRRLDASTNSSVTWPFNRDRYFFFTLDMSDKSQTLSAAFDAGVASYLKETAGAWEDTFTEELQQASIEMGVKMLRPVQSAHEITREYVLSAREEVEAAVALIGNALCYLSAEPEVSEPDLPGDTPFAQAQAFMAGTGSAHKTAKAQLLDQGISVIRWLGPRSSPGDAHRANVIAGTGATKIAHWRRGHWRRQPYGPAHSLRRLKWIAPMMVGGEAGDQRDRVYLVDTLEGN
jgi:hypothetical protein